MKKGPTGEIRITGGLLRGRRIGVPRKNELRPTQDRVREAVFNSIGPRLPGAKVLDLFAGTGALGLEAWSRGAGEVWWVEREPLLVAALEKNVRALCVDGGATHCVQADAYSFLDQPPDAARGFDVVLADPPYERDGEALQKTLFALRAAPILKASGLLVFEQAAAAKVPTVSEWRILRDRRYGSTRVLMLVIEPESGREAE